MQEYWRGSVNQWECDEMGHMNVRFWVRRSMEGLAVMAPAIGLPHAFRAGTGATILPLDQHIKFIREAHAGAPLFLRGGVVSIDETTATLYQEVVHAISGEIGATFRTIIAHVEAKTGQQFPWSDKARTAMAARLVSVPEHGLPRSVPYDDPPATDAGVARADTLGVTRVGLMPVSPDELDNFGRIRAELFIGRVSDAVPNLMTEWRKQVAAAANAADGVARRPGAAVLEYRLATSWRHLGNSLRRDVGKGQDTRACPLDSGSTNRAGMVHLSSRGDHSGLGRPQGDGDARSPTQTARRNGDPGTNDLAQSQPIEDFLRYMIGFPNWGEWPTGDLPLEPPCRVLGEKALM
jgi:acyl-CoA thioester hydrolase